MGFRDPVTSLSANDITPGTLLGSAIATASSGRRVELTVTPSPAVDFYSGSSVEIDPGQVASDVDVTSGDASILLASPTTSAVPSPTPATLQLAAPGPASAKGWSRFLVDADELLIATLAGQLRMNSVEGFVLGGNADVSGSLVVGPKSLPVAGSLPGHTSLTVPAGASYAAFNIAPPSGLFTSPVALLSVDDNNLGQYFVVAHPVSATQIYCIVRRYSGTAAAGGEAVTVHWSVRERA